MAYDDLQPHQQRVVDEHNELHDCIRRLELFIAQSPVFKTLPHTGQEMWAIERSAQALERAAREFTKIAPAGDETASGLADSYDMAANEVRLQIPAYAAMQARNLAKIKAWDKASAPPQLERWDAASYPPSTFCRECGEDHGDKQLAAPDPLASKCCAGERGPSVAEKCVTCPYRASTAAPSGYVLVPREPTEEMVEAGIAALFEASIRDLEATHGEMQSACRAALAAAPQPSNPSTPAGQVQALRDSLRTMVELCAIGDVDENTEAHGWGDAIKRAKELLEGVAHESTAPTSAAGVTNPNELTSSPEPAPSRASGLLPVAREGLRMPSDSELLVAQMRCGADDLDRCHRAIRKFCEVNGIPPPASGDAPGEAK